MNPLTGFGLSAMLTVALTSLPGSTFAQQKSLKEQLVGAWTLVSCDATQPYCADTNPNGILILDASGRYTVGIAAQGRPKFSTFNRLEARAEEYKAVAIGFRLLSEPYGRSDRSIAPGAKQLFRKPEPNPAAKENHGLVNEDRVIYFRLTR